MVLALRNAPDNTDKNAGSWLEKFAKPYYVFKDSGAEITVASTLGGQLPDPKTDAPESQAEAAHRFKVDILAQNLLAHSVKLDSVWAETFDAVFFPGGHGPLWDLAEDADSIKLIETLGERLGRKRWHLRQGTKWLAHVATDHNLMAGKTRRHRNRQRMEVMRPLQARTA
ncbi:MAG: hypothetical protein PHR71_02925 [Polaromonas sp.]|nr:hypothetical protein [Polaromonas sp.]